MGEASFRAMGSRCRLTVFNDGSDLAPMAREFIDRLESAWSRFRPDSELSQLALRSGVPTLVGPETSTLIDRALRAWSATGGLFDPTMADELAALGYDRTHVELEPALPGTPVANPGNVITMRRTRCREIVHDLRSGLAWLPPGVALDPGGIGKGLAADLTAEKLIESGARGGYIDLGGDIRFFGRPPGQLNWEVEVEDPFRPGTSIGSLYLGSGGVATSSTLSRRWRQGEAVHHHLLDPRTGSPVDNGLASVTVLAAETWWAESLAKAALIAGRNKGSKLIESHGAAGLFIDLEGDRHTAGDLSRFGGIK